MNRIVDLTLPVETDMLAYPRPWHTAVSITRMGSIETVGRATSRVVIGSHSGTHCDAPAHFLPGGGTVETLSLDRLVGPAWVLDFSRLAPGSAIDVPMLRERLGDAVPRRLLFRFDWQQRWGRMAYFEEHPHLTEAAAEWLVGNGVWLLGVDAPMLDDPAGQPGGVDSPIHKILLRAGVILVEYLCNLDQLPDDAEVFFMAMPLKLVGADGAPARCAAAVAG
ncbi:Kynurenine formamidase [anaerobic digester metagenome]